MMRKIFAVGALAALVAAPAFAMTGSNPILNHTGGPIPYSQLTQMTSGSGYNSRAAKARHRHMQTAQTAAPAASPDAAGPSPTPADTTPAPADTTVPAPPTVSPSSSTSTMPAPAVTSTPTQPNPQ